MDIAFSIFVIKYFMKKSLKTYLKTAAKDYSSRSVNPPVVRASTILFKTMQELRKHQKDIAKGKDLVNVSDRWVKQTDSLPLKLQWMSHILMDSIKYKASKECAEIMPDTATMTNYLGEKSDIHNLHELLNQTNKLLSMVVSETNLRKEYQLQSLFVDWERKLQISAI